MVPKNIRCLYGATMIAMARAQGQTAKNTIGQLYVQSPYTPKGICHKPLQNMDIIFSKNYGNTVPTIYVNHNLN